MFVRRRRRAFFSAAHEGDDDGQGVAEDAANLGLWDEAGEAVDVQESFEFGHRRIVTSSPRQRKPNCAGKTGGRPAPNIEKHPHDFTKSLKYRRTSGGAITSRHFPRSRTADQE